MQDTKITVASLKSIIIDPQENLQRMRQAVEVAERDGARLLFLPELMLSGHGGHPKMVENAEPVPDGPLSSAVLEMSAAAGIAICVGIAELDHGIVYNSQFVVDRGEYLGLQRKINLSSDEYLWFGTGETLPVFDLGDLCFGIIICYDNCFPELALACGLQHADLILAPHAARVGVWPDPISAEEKQQQIRSQQAGWRLLHAARACDHNLFVLLCNAVGSSVQGLSELDEYGAVGPGGLDPRAVIANHVGTVMGFDPDGAVILETQVEDFVDEIVTVELMAAKRHVNHQPSRNRRSSTMLDLLAEASALGS